MPAKYELLPTEPDYTPSSSRSGSPPSYLPPYEASLDFPSSLDGSTNALNSADDVEHEAPRRGRSLRRRESIPTLDLDPRFRRPPPSPWARAGIIGLMFFLFWLSYNMRRTLWIEGGMGVPPKPSDEEFDRSY